MATMHELVKYYDRLRTDTGCALNLDLQRMAIPATPAQHWRIARAAKRRRTGEAAGAAGCLHGRRVSRIVVESEDDSRHVSSATANVPVVHLAEVAGALPFAQRNVA